MKMRRFWAAATAVTLLLGAAATPEVGSEIKLALTAHAASGEIPIDEEHFPDADFREIVKDFDYNESFSLSADEIAETKKISCAYSDAASLTGIEYFTSLTYLDCSYCKLTKLDVSNNTALTYLNCWDNQLTSLDVSKNTALTDLICGCNDLTELDVSNNTSLSYLDCSDNQIKTLDVTKTPKIFYLNCSGNQLTELDISTLKELIMLYCFKNKLTTLDVSNNQMLLEAYGAASIESDSVITYFYYYAYEFSVDKGVSIVTEYVQSTATADVAGSAKNDKIVLTDMDITFFDANRKPYSAQVNADGKIMLPSLTAGVYTVTASLENCAPRDYTVKVEEGKPVELNVELKFYGDVNGDGKATTADISKINEQVQKINDLPEEYDNKVADVNGDGKVTTSDLSKINEHVQQSKLMW